MNLIVVCKIETFGERCQRSGQGEHLTGYHDLSWLLHQNRTPDNRRQSLVRDTKRELRATVMQQLSPTTRGGANSSSQVPVLQGEINPFVVIRTKKTRGQAHCVCLWFYLLSWHPMKTHCNLFSWTLDISNHPRWLTHNILI